ncbi:MAG: CBS domain-containing protein [Myxococcaceae bacterium]|nr:CBS domain-containing protein [Myxococcaceae bacterium]MCA3014934.1 CBS domain-containing protein [Myxococcaceae bacterium]
MSEKATDDEVTLPVRRRVTLLDTGARLERRTVHCSRFGPQAVEACGGCEHFVALDATPGAEAVRCHGPEPLAAPPTVDEALGPESWCLDPELPVETACALLEARHLASAPVVDDAGVLVGIVRLASLRALEARARALALRHPDAATSVAEEALEPAPAVLTPGAPLALAAELMRVHGLTELPVVAAGARLVGVLEVRNLLRFFGARGAP